MRYFTVEITPPAEGSKDWKVVADALPQVRDFAPTGPHEDGFFIAPEGMPTEQAFEQLRADMLARVRDQIAQLTARAESLAALQCPQFEPLHWQAA